MRKVAAAAAVILVMLLPCGAKSQTIYGMNYIGEAVHMGSSRHEALGYSAVAVQDTTNSVTSNPASTADLNKVTLTVHQVLSASRVYFLDYDSRQTRYTVPTFTASFPLRKGLVLTAGYRTRFYGRADFAYQIEVENAPTAFQNYKLDSNLFMLPVIMAWRPLSSLRVAAEAQFNLGSVIDKVNVWFNDLEYKNVNSKRRRSYSGISWGASVLWEAHPRLWLGCNIDGPVDYFVDEVIENTTAVLDTTTSFDYSLPLAFDVGFAANPFGRWWLSSSYWMRSSTAPTGFPQLEGNVGDETHIGIGIERRASREGHTLNRIPIRLGFYTDKWHIQFPEGQEVTSMFLTVGSAIPLGNSPGAIDFTLEFGRTGSKTVNFVEENIFRFGLSFSVAESWSRRKTVRH
ncbi:MAG: hypothetical protein KAU49_05395 [Candidatus Krumholzibacteria bacterium]|nr:hypothetical protein [Candidatus Krumholzibacteria bacterium]